MYSNFYLCTDSWSFFLTSSITGSNSSDYGILVLLPTGHKKLEPKKDFYYYLIFLTVIEIVNKN